MKTFEQQKKNEGKGVTQPNVIRSQKAREYEIASERGYRKASELARYADMSVTW